MNGLHQEKAAGIAESLKALSTGSYVSRLSPLVAQHEKMVIAGGRASTAKILCKASMTCEKRSLKMETGNSMVLWF